jgi:hypothetical protein
MNIQSRGSHKRSFGRTPCRPQTRAALAHHQEMLTLSSESLYALPVDERGLLVLQDLLDEKEWNERSYLLRYQTQRPAGRAIAEALAWLRGRAFIALDPDQDSTDAIFVTARGHEALAQGLTTVRTVEAPVSRGAASPWWQRFDRRCGQRGRPRRVCRRRAGCRPLSWIPGRRRRPRRLSC